MGSTAQVPDWVPRDRLPDLLDGTGGVNPGVRQPDDAEKGSGDGSHGTQNWEQEEHLALGESDPCPDRYHRC